MLRPMHAVLQSQNGSNPNRRTLAITLVASLHVLLFWGLVNGFIPSVIEKTGELAFVPVPEPKIEKTEKGPAPEFVDPSGTKVVAPVPTWETESDSIVGADPMPLPGAVQTTENSVADIGPLAANARSIPPYPALEARMGVEGKVTIRLTISESGLVTAANLVKSSGSSGLDRAAISWVLGNWKYRPAIHDGRPVASSTEVTVNFTLTGRR